MSQIRRLSTIHDRFTEGFEAADLKAAKVTARRFAATGNFGHCLPDLRSGVK
jgi:hypothetical protein